MTVRTNQQAFDLDLILELTGIMIDQYDWVSKGAIASGKMNGPATAELLYCVRIVHEWAAIELGSTRLRGANDQTRRLRAASVAGA